MKNEDHQQLIAYIDKWNAIDGVKPCNEKEFIDLFYKLFLDYDDREIEFNGEGSYFGKQVTLMPDRTWGKTHRNLRFKVAYSMDKISVYSANNEGFWCPEFIRLTKGDNEFDALILAWFNFLTGVFGL
jgi:hypothetical protein